MSKKGKNWLEKFQSFWWKDLTHNQRLCLWDVLTALRGPDKEEVWTSEQTRCSTIKRNTTARIRYLLLGKITKKMRSYCGFVEKLPTQTITRKDMDSLGEHFTRHTVYAIQKLNGVVKQPDMQDLIDILEGSNESYSK